MACEYDPGAADLLVFSKPKVQTLSTRPSLQVPVSADRTLLRLVNNNLTVNYPCHLSKNDYYLLDNYDLDLMKRWTERTVLSIGTPDIAITYQKEIAGCATTVRQAPTRYRRHAL